MVRGLLGAMVGAWALTVVLPTTGWTAEQSQSKADREKEMYIMKEIDRPLKINSKKPENPEDPQKLYLILRTSHEFVKLEGNQLAKVAANVVTARDGTKYEKRTKFYLDMLGSSKEAKEFLLPWMTEHMKFGLSRKEQIELAKQGGPPPPMRSFKVQMMVNNDPAGRKRVDEKRGQMQKYLDDYQKRQAELAKKKAEAARSSAKSWAAPRR